MKVGIFEYVSGGGVRGEHFPHNMLCEGYSMLKAVTEDFQTAGHEVTTLLDSRLVDLQNHLKADKIEKVSSTDTVKKVLVEMLKTVDLSFIIAPETEGILSSFVRMARPITISLNSTPESIDLVSDKAKLAEAFLRNRIPTPETFCLHSEDGIEEAERLLSICSGQVVVKPIDGAGCERVFFVNNLAHLRQVFEIILKESPEKRFIIQKFVEGIPASVSLILNDTEARPISLNLQNILLNAPPEPSHYLGGVTPLFHPDADKALDIAIRAAKSFKGLKGFVGVDIVLSPQGPVVLEINPRLTVPYVGLRRISKVNLVDSMINASFGKPLPTSFKIQGTSTFSKISSKELERINGEVEILCPQIQVEGVDTNCFIVEKSEIESKNNKSIV